ncbi:unnamed protein product [Prunus armeniaca]
MLKSATICGNFGRVTGGENENIAQSFDVGLCANLVEVTCVCGSRFCSRELQQVVTASKAGLPSIG